MSTTVDSSHDVPYPVVDEQLGEKLQPDEARLVTEMANVIEQGIRKQYQPGEFKRDVHARSTGVLRAVFKVNENIPGQFAHGVFIPGKSYEAIVRLSNGSGEASTSDNHPDTRGFAFKLLGVLGEKILESDKHAQTQDFVMINHPMFVTNMADKYLALVTKNQGSVLQKATIPFILGLKGTINAGILTSGKISNPLQVQYFSAVPYQLGLGPERLAIKFSIKPVSSAVDPFPTKAGDHFLHEAVKASLNKGPVEYRFLLQPRKGPHMDVEDSMREWSEKESPFVEVATLTILQQDVDDEELNKLGERLSFNPWHALPEHRPLGSINRMRKIVYERISRVRDTMNGVQREEPTSIPQPGPSRA
ncbi:hypothetical protein EMPS_10746 [Entomortierella parvispora]|uniref:Catalase core domain-containing protein n=1 Tax=Entomortierella parvispora TaxID=205924 RepID=A0A9P3HKK9_9FUNG|nr:hypothetical protein EMPS_10746 [Entomortierella parvispora]